MKLAQIYQRRFPEIPVQPDINRPHPHTSVGIEVELEQMRWNFKENLKRWYVTKEGSIINGIEFVSDPVWGTAIRDALEELKEALEDHKPRVSFRTSTHIHMNVLDLDLDELIHLIYLYIMYEPALFRYHDRWRRADSIFCVPAYLSMDIREAYVKLIADLRRGKGRGTYLQSKYAALNINALQRQGSLEFRHMGGSIDIDEIDEWINILLQLKLAALNMADIEDPDAVWGPYRARLNILPEDMIQGRDFINIMKHWS